MQQTKQKKQRSPTTEWRCEMKVNWILCRILQNGRFHTMIVAYFCIWNIRWRQNGLGPRDRSIDACILMLECRKHYIVDRLCHRDEEELYDDLECRDTLLARQIDLKTYFFVNIAWCSSDMSDIHRIQNARCKRCIYLIIESKPLGMEIEYCAWRMLIKTLCVSVLGFTLCPFYLCPLASPCLPRSEFHCVYVFSSYLLFYLSFGCGTAFHRYILAAAAACGFHLGPCARAHFELLHNFVVLANPRSAITLCEWAWEISLWSTNGLLGAAQIFNLT